MLAAERTAPGFVDERRLDFRMKLRWFGDLLGHGPARHYLWSLYYAGEAYEALHPQGVYVDKLPAPWGALLARHLSDETRHARVFEALLAEAGLEPRELSYEEDVGWYLLNHVVPDVVAGASRPGPFTLDEAARYMAFLHVLELRSLTDLAALARAAETRGELDLAERLQGILKDELFHATYTHRALFRLAPNRRRALEILDQIRRSEREHYGRALRSILEGFERTGLPRGGTWDRFRWRAMKRLTDWGLAVPLLPLYETLPARLGVATTSRAGER